MVTNLLGTGQALDSSVNSLISRFNLLTDAAPTLRSCATMLQLMAHDGLSKNLNNYNRMVAFSVADGQDISQVQALADTTTSYTPGEVAVQTWLPGSTMRRAADPDLMGRTSRILMNALTLKEDQDGGLQLPNFVPIMGAAAVVLGPGEYLGAAVRLALGNSRSNPEPPPAPWWTIDHPIKLATVAGRIIPLSDAANAAIDHVYTNITSHLGIRTDAGFGGGEPGSLSGDILINGPQQALGKLFGIVVKQTPNIIPDVNDDVSGASFSQEGLIYVSEIPARLDPDTSDKSFRGAVELNAWMSYAWGLYRSSAYGVEILGDATMPVA